MKIATLIENISTKLEELDTSVAAPTEGEIMDFISQDDDSERIMWHFGIDDEAFDATEIVDLELTAQAVEVLTEWWTIELVADQRNG